MPVTPPPAEVSQQLPADDARLPGAMVAKARAFWLVAARSARRAPEACPEGKEGEIVVCAPQTDHPARDRLGAPIPDAPTAMQELSQKMRVKVGPGELAPGGGNVPMVGVTYRIRF